METKTMFTILGIIPEELILNEMQKAITVHSTLNNQETKKDLLYWTRLYCLKVEIDTNPKGAEGLSNDFNRMSELVDVLRNSKPKEN